MSKFLDEYEGRRFQTIGLDRDSFIHKPNQWSDLIAHARALEAMLEWALDTISDEHGEEFAFCPICEKLKEARKVLE